MKKEEGRRKKIRRKKKGRETEIRILLTNTATNIINILQTYTHDTTEHKSTTK